MQYFAAISAGPEIAHLSGTQGKVLAVLSNAVYLRSNRGHIIGIVGQAAEDGPLALRVNESDTLIRLLRGQDNLSFAYTQTFIELQGMARIALSHAQQWWAQVPASIRPISQRLQAVRVLLGMLEMNGCNGGACALASYLYGPHLSLPLPTEIPILKTNSTAGDLLLRRLAQRVTRFQAAACELETEAASKALVSLLGLGDGLTPSGDDIVAGVLASLVWQVRLGTVPLGFAQRLVEAIRKAAPHRTNQVSSRLLWYAADGLLYAPAMELGAALLAGDVGSIIPPARRLLVIGHSSGAHITTGLIAGIVAGIEIESRSMVPSC
jgi:hypothetical protein